MNQKNSENDLQINTKTKKDEIVWVLLDSRRGHKNQAIAVANKLNLKYKSIDIKYKYISILPNFVLNLFGGLIHVQKSIRDKLCDPWPKIIIACGRRTAPIARWVKKASKGNSFHAQIMWPGIGWFSNSDIDIIATPKHDRIVPKKNIFYTYGIPHEINNTRLKRAKIDWKNELKALPSPRTTILIGGNTKNGRFTRKMISSLLEECIKIAKPKGSLLVTSSRRTDSELIKYIDDILENSKLKFFVWHEHQNHDDKMNPYIGLLAYADNIVVTGDSVSMLSEACSVGKPVYIYSTKSLYSKKHSLFHESLIKNQYAQLLGSNIVSGFSSKAIDDSEKIAKKIKEMIKM